jgi:signal transduction histidine kinase
MDRVASRSGSRPVLKQAAGRARRLRRLSAGARAASDMEPANIVVVGAGSGGYEFLKVLTATPNVTIQYVCDINPAAKGVLFAREHGIRCVSRIGDFIDDDSYDLIFESTGRNEVFEELTRRKRASVSLVGSAGTRVIFSLLDSYNEANRNLRSYKLNLERRIIERTEELEKANAELEREKSVCEHLFERQLEINQEKSRYLTQSTHQLKAPFAAIQHYVELILDDYTGPVTDQTRAILGKVKRRCALLSETIADMLELARLQSHIVNMARHDVAIADVIKELQERFSVTAASKSITLALCVDDGLVMHTNQQQLFDLLAVFLDNAIKYSPAGSTVELSAGRDGDQVVIQIKDQGIGIPVEHKSRIFTEFFRANNAVRFEPNGNGLGLAIARELADLLEATIEVDSRLNEGSVFRVRL